MLCAAEGYAVSTSVGTNAWDSPSMAMRGLRGGLLGLALGLVLAAVVYAVVKPGPCSETAVCIFDTIRRACRPGPCESRTSHVGVLVLIAAASAAAGVGISLLREARSRR